MPLYQRQKTSKTIELDHCQDDLVYAQRNGIAWFPLENKGGSAQRNEKQGVNFEIHSFSYKELELF